MDAPYRPPRRTPVAPVWEIAAMRIRRPVVVIVGVALLVGASGCGTTVAAEPAGSAPSIEWRSCRGGECGSLAVPLDPAKPRGRTIRLALFRAEATSERARKGVLLINPGGPGASGIDATRYLASALGRRVRRSFDLVGWDPRGTGSSAAIDCGDELDYLFRPDTAPDDAAERTELERASARFARACARRSGALLDHVSSQDTVGDMERIRIALGERRLNFLGYSYGTLLGALYANRYPGRVRAMVLDGAVDPTVPPEASLIQQAQGFDAGLARFFAWCDARRTCGYGGGDSAAAYGRLRAAIDTTPIRAEGRRFGPTQMDLGVGSFLYSGEGGYRTLAEGLAALEDDDPAIIQAASDDYVGRRDGGRYDPSWGAFLAISCLDGPRLGTTADLEAVSARAAAAAPEFGASSVGLGTPCATWPTPPVFAAPAAISAPGAPPIVVIGTRNDPVTPLSWAQGLAAQLGVGHLVVAPGAQHTGYPQGDDCLDPFVEDYLVDLRVPPEGAACG
ncbi:MAG: alpha/beta hydrolase [Actinomycetes bacterium]